MKITWLQNFTQERKDSIWYGGDIVVIELERYQITIGAYGEIRACINDNYYCDKCNGGSFAEYLVEEGINNDTELKEAIEKGIISFENNNWFEAFIWDKQEKDYVETYDTVIDELSPDDDFSWIKDWLENLIH